MANLNSNINGELPRVADKQSEAAASSTHVSVEIKSVESKKTQRRILHRVPQQLKDNKEGIYEPVVLSIGPYHHNKSEQFRRVDEFKDEVLNIILEPADKLFARRRILERVDEIRIFYEGVSREEHDDDALAEMILRDACFLIYYMRIWHNRDKWIDLVRRLGLPVVGFLNRDLYMLENQIPLWVLNILVTLIFEDKDEGEALLYDTVSRVNFGDKRLTKLPWEEGEEEPLHLFECGLRALVKEDMSSRTTKHSKVQSLFKWRWRWTWRKSDQSSNLLEMMNTPFRSVTDLKAKGIHFRPSSYCLKDIRFSSYMFYGMLRIPIRRVTSSTKVYFSNLIAFEMSPATDNDLEVLSYINFMKSLIESPKDVKELRERGILFSPLSDEEVVKIFKDQIDTYGMDISDIFQDIKIRINKHCNSKGKMWIAELLHTYLHNPWAAIAVLASAFLLCLTFVQTYCTMYPKFHK